MYNFEKRVERVIKKANNEKNEEKRRKIIEKETKRLRKIEEKCKKDIEKLNDIEKLLDKGICKLGYKIIGIYEKFGNKEDVDRLKEEFKNFEKK